MVLLRLESRHPKGSFSRRNFHNSGSWKCVHYGQRKVIFLQRWVKPVEKSAQLRVDPFIFRITAVGADCFEYATVCDTSIRCKRASSSSIIFIAALSTGLFVRNTQFALTASSEALDTLKRITSSLELPRVFQASSETMVMFDSVSTFNSRNAPFLHSDVYLH